MSSNNFLDISNIINVSVVNAPVGLPNYNINNVALFSNETPLNYINIYSAYNTASAVAADFGTSSLTYQMASALFAQTPNILSAGGQLYVIPMINKVNGTSGAFTTSDLSSLLSNFKSVNNGSLKINIDGTSISYTGLNFTGVETLNDVVTVLNTAIIDVDITLSTNEIEFTSKTYGTASAVSFLSSSSGTDLTGALYLNTSNGTSATGTAPTGEHISDAILRTQNDVFYAGVLDTTYLDNAAIEATATAIASLDKIWLHEVRSTQNIPVLGAAISSAKETNTRLLLHTASELEAKLFTAAYAGLGFSVDYTGSNTAITMNLKQLATINPNTSITQTIYDIAETNGVDMYVSYGGYPSVASTGGNDYFDNVTNKLWLKLALKIAYFNALAQTNTKVPQTESGMTFIKTQLQQVMDQSVTNGVTGTGITWNSADTFGDPVSFKRNVFNTGYYIYSSPIAKQTQADRIARKAPLVQIAIKEAGAVHSTSIVVNINP